METCILVIVSSTMMVCLSLSIMEQFVTRQPMSAALYSDSLNTYLTVNLNAAFEALLGLSEDTLDEKKKEEYMTKMYDIYHDFEMRSVGEQSLTQIMMKTVRCAVEDAGAVFGEEAFPIIRALMYLDGLVIRTHPDVKFISSMSPYLEEFRACLPIPEPVSPYTN